MRCEGPCGRVFRNGDRIYAVPTRIVVVRHGREQLTDIETYYCTMCSPVPIDPTTLYTAGVARVG